MSPLQGFFCLIICFFLPNAINLLFGLWLAKTERLHKVGVRMLAMSFFVSGRFVARKCRQNCECARCGNWTCSKY